MNEPPVDSPGFMKWIVTIGIAAFAWLVGKVFGAVWTHVESKVGSIEKLLSRVGALEKQNEMQQVRIDELAKYWQARNSKRKGEIEALQQADLQLLRRLEELTRGR